MNTYGWWTVATYATFAGPGLAVAAGAILLAMLIEIFLAIRASETREGTASSPRLAHQG